MPWSGAGQMDFNKDKCKITHFGYENIKHEYKLLGELLSEAEKEKDLRLVICNDQKIQKAVLRCLL